MVRALAAHVAFGEPVELSVNEWREFFEGFFLAVAPRCQKLSKIVSPRPVHGPRNLSHCRSLAAGFRGQTLVRSAPSPNHNQENQTEDQQLGETDLQH